MNIIDVKDLYYKADSTNIINGISISIKKGECISLVGQSGSGKSTFLKLISDLLPISEGEIFFKGESYSDLNPLELRRNISYCPQSAYLFGKNVYENLEFPFKLRNEEMNRDKVVSLLERFGLNKGYLIKDVNSLSGGEKQRIGIIRNLVYTPEIILLDEATSALDMENSHKVEDYIREINNEGVTVLWITHSVEQSERIFDKRIVISNGKVEKVEEVK